MVRAVVHSFHFGHWLFHWTRTIAEGSHAHEHENLAQNAENAACNTGLTAEQIQHIKSSTGK